MSKRYPVNIDHSGAGLLNAGENIVDTKELVPFTFEECVNDLATTMMIRIYEFNPEMRDKIVERFNQVVEGGDFTSYAQYAQIEKHRVPPTYFFHGPAGHGKTAIAKEAAKRVTEALDLNLVTSFPRDYVPAPNDFVLPLIEMSNETSSLLVGGIPYIGKVKGVRVGDEPNAPVEEFEVEQMSRALYHLFDVAKQATYGAVILDDISNLPQKVQNIMASLLETSSFQNNNFGSAKTFIGTGNLGAADGSIAKPLSSAMITRANGMYVQSDAANETAPYIMRKYLGEELDGAMSAYLTYVQDVLKKEPYEKTRKNSSHLSPRSADNLAGQIARLMSMFDHLDSTSPESAILEAKAELRNEIEKTIGLNQSQQIAEFMTDYMVNFLPIGREISEAEAPEDVRKVSGKIETLLSDKNQFSNRIKDEMMMSDALLGSMFQVVIEERRFSKMDALKRDLMNYEYSSLFKDFTDQGKDFAAKRVENSVPALMKECGNFKPEVIQQAVEKFKQIVAGEFPKPEKEKAASKEKENDLEHGQ
jgi:MoxR-like ATPase